MSSKDNPSEGSETARIVGQLVKYSREGNRSDTVEEGEPTHPRRPST